MQVISINLRDEQVKVLEYLKITKKITSRAEFFRRLFDQEVNNIVTLYERFGILTNTQVIKQNGF